MNFPFFLILTNQKLIFVNWKSVSVMTGSTFFLLQPKLISLAVLSSNYWLYYFNVTRFQIYFWTFRIIALLLKSYHVILTLMASQLVQWIIDKVFRRKTYGLNGFNTSFSQFSTAFLVFACFCCCFHSHKTYCDIWMITYAWQTFLFSQRAIIEPICWLPVKAIKFYACQDFKKIFWTPFLVNCKSVSVMTEPISFLLQNKSSLRFYVSTIGYMTSMPQHNRFFLILGHFVLSVPFEILSCYTIINGSHLLSEDFQWIVAVIFRVKLMV